MQILIVDTNCYFQLPLESIQLIVTPLFRFIELKSVS